MASRIVNNRLTRCFSRPLVKILVQYHWGQIFINRIYQRLSPQQRKCFYDLFHLLFDDETSSVQEGEWKVRFCGEKILLPLKGERIWLDWNLATSILGHEVEVTTTFQSLVESDKCPEVFIDIGANYGIYSFLFLSQGIETISFEPNPHCHDYFREVCQKNNFQGHLKAKALGEHSGKVKIKFPPKRTWLASVVPSVQKGLAARGELVEEVVEQARLDDYWDLWKNRRLLIKIDTEGMEEEVLRGAKKNLEEGRPSIIFESWHGRGRREIFDILSNFQYQIFNLPFYLYRRAASLKRSDFLESRETNFLALPQEEGRKLNRK